jgi:hypothetical protein
MGRTWASHTCIVDLPLVVAGLRWGVREGWVGFWGWCSTMQGSRALLAEAHDGNIGKDPIETCI